MPASSVIWMPVSSWASSRFGVTTAASGSRRSLTASTVPADSRLSPCLDTATGSTTTGASTPDSMPETVSTIVGRRQHPGLDRLHADVAEHRARAARRPPRRTAPSTPGRRPSSARSRRRPRSCRARRGRAWSSGRPGCQRRLPSLSLPRRARKGESLPYPQPRRTGAPHGAQKAGGAGTRRTAARKAGARRLASAEAAGGPVEAAGGRPGRRARRQRSRSGPRCPSGRATATAGRSPPRRPRCCPAASSPPRPAGPECRRR